MRRLSARDRRALLAGGVLVALAVLSTRGLPAWFELLGRSRDDAVLARRGLADARAVIAAAPALRDSLAARRSRYIATAPALIAAATPSAAASRLSALVSAAAMSAGVAVSSVMLRADTVTANGFGRPSVRGEARGDISGLTQFLLLMEIGPPLLRVAELTVTQSDPTRTGRPEELRIAFLIEGMSLLERPPVRNEPRQ